MRRGPALLVAILVLVATGCRIDADVDLIVREDGSGRVEVVVTLDEEAAGRAVDLTADLRTEDLTEAGWTVLAPEQAADGSVTIQASKPFRTPAEAAIVLDELTGADGPLGDLVVRRDNEFGRTSFEVVGSLDPTGGLAALSDPALTALLGGQPLGLLAQEVQDQLEVDPGSLVGVSLEVDLPGDETVAGTGAGRAGDGSAQWRMTLADDQPVPVQVTSEEERLAPWLALGAAALAALLLVLVVLIRTVRLIRRRRAQRRGRLVEPPAPAPAAGPRLELIVVDAMGVLFETGDDVHDLLVPFLRSEGCDLPEAEIVAVHADATLGRLSSAELWAQLGLADDPAVLDELYLARHRLRPGAIEFLQRVRRQGLQVACCTNDVAEWSRRLREEHRLDRYIDVWVVSAETGIRKPAVGAYEAVRRETGVPFAHAIVLDDRLPNLDVARSLGMATCWFVPTAAPGFEAEHPVIRGFGELGL